MGTRKAKRVMDVSLSPEAHNNLRMKALLAFRQWVAGWFYMGVTWSVLFAYGQLNGLIVHLCPWSIIARTRPGPPTYG